DTAPAPRAPRDQELPDHRKPAPVTTITLPTVCARSQPRREPLMTPTHTDTPVREIESGSNPSRFARGWHCLGLAEDFDDGKPHMVKIFGTSLVVFRTRSEEHTSELQSR